jgi:hypothetical protein
MEVSRDAVRISNDAGQTFSVPVAQLCERYAITVRGDKDFDTTRPSYPTTGGVGLFVQGGTLRVRRALLEPLSETDRTR